MKIANCKLKIKSLRHNKIAFALTIAGLAAISIFLVKVINQNKVLAAWFNEDWGYRKSIAISAHTASENSVYINLTGANDIDTSDTTRFQGDCGDLRFTKQNGELLPYYISSGCGTADTVVHVFFYNFPAGAQTIYYYYGNPSAPNGFSASDFSTEASSYTIGSKGSEETTPGTVAYWKFDDGQGTNAQDSSPNNLDGTLNNTPTWNTEDKCVSGKCLYFDGTNNENVSKADDSKLDFSDTASFTTQAWIRRNGASSAINYIITKHDVTDDTEDGGYKLYMDDSGDFCFGIDDDITWDPDVSACTSGVDFDDDKWHLVTGVRSVADDKIYLYVDGNQRTSTTDSTTATLANSNIFYIGVDRDGTSNEWLGFIDDAKIYSYQRTAAQIKQDYLAAVKNAGTKIGALGVLGAKPEDYLSTNLKGYWKMDETAANSCSGGANDVCDSSGNGRDGAWAGGATNITGKFDQGVDFQGTDDYVSFGTTDPLSNASKATFATWIYLDKTTGTQEIFQKDEGVSNQGWAAYLSGSDMGFYSDPTANTVTASLTTSTWTHLVWVFDSGTVYFYKNGALLGSQAGYTSSLVATAGTFALGIKVSNGLGDLDGRMDEARMYNRAFSPKEVRDLYSFAPGPVGYWKMDEKSGTTIDDTSGNAYVSSAFTGNTAWTQGKYGGGLSFDGDGDVARVVEGTKIDVGATTSSYTVGAWVKTTADYSGNAAVVAKDDGSGAYPFELYLNSSEYACFDVSDGTNTPSSCGTTALNDGKWHYLSGVRDVLNDKTYIYVDGVQINSATDSTTATDANNDDVSVGNAGTSYVANDFNGSIDDVKIYNYARTQKQIVEDMNASHPAVGSPVGSPVAHWKLDEGYSTTANDATSNDNDLTLSSASWTDSGKFSKAWNGTGALWLSRVDDDDFDFAATDDFAISLWYKSDSANNPGAVEYLFNKANATTAGYAVYANTSGNLCFGIDDDTSWGPDISSCTSTDLYDGNWHNIIAVRDYSSSDKTYIYVDGIVRDSDSDTTNATLANSLSLYVGDRDGTDNGDEFNGDIDEVKVYRFALTSDEVKTEYNKGQSLVLGVAGNNSSYQIQAANQEYCIPGDSTSCTAPVGRWDFEEGKGTSANDTSGNGNTGTLGGDGAGTDLPTWSNGKYGKGLSFDGSDDYVDMSDPSSGSLDMGTSSITISAWVKTNSATNQTIVSKRNSGTGSTGYRFRISSSGNLLATMTDVSANQVDPNTSGVNILDNKWHYVAVVLNRTTNLASFYVDGIASTVSAADLSGATGSVSNAINFRVGYTPDNVQPFNGRIDQVRIFNYARSAAQVVWDYNRGKPIGWWKLDECQGSTAYDSSGLGYNGTITIGASGDNSAAGTCTSSGAWYNGVSGKRNYSLDLGGTDDYITVTDTANLRFDASTSDFSLFAWVKRTTTGTEYIISKEDADNDGYRLLFTSSNTVQCSEDATDVTSTSTIADTNWHLIGCTIDRDGNGQVYIDGRVDGSAAAMGTDAMATTSNITFGTRSYTSTSYFNGQIDDVRVYNYGLTAVQVRNIYNEGAVRFGPNVGSP